MKGILKSILKYIRNNRLKDFPDKENLLSVIEDFCNKKSIIMPYKELEPLVESYQECINSSNKSYFVNMFKDYVLNKNEYKIMFDDESLEYYLNVLFMYIKNVSGFGTHLIKNKFTLYFILNLFYSYKEYNNIKRIFFKYDNINIFPYSYVDNSVDILYSFYMEVLFKKGYNFFNTLDKVLYSEYSKNVGNNLVKYIKNTFDEYLDDLVKHIYKNDLDISEVFRENFSFEMNVKYINQNLIVNKDVCNKNMDILLFLV